MGERIIFLIRSKILRKKKRNDASGNYNADITLDENARMRNRNLGGIISEWQE
jgi:hypothetical protein